MANTPNLVKALGNSISTTLSSAINDTDLTISVASGTGMNATGGFALIDPGLSNAEVVYVESVSGTTLTIATDGRGQGGTAAASHSIGAVVTDIIIDDHVNGISTSFAAEHDDDGEHNSVLMSKIYPIGSIYISVVSTNPNTLFGFGTWEAFATGRTLVGIDAAQTEFDTVEETGGSKTHTLTTGQMPTHSHAYSGNIMVGEQTSSGLNTGFEPGTAYQKVGLVSDSSPGATVTSAGSGQSHNNLQPYVVVYMWKRTA